jgi:hypothetical protein
VANRSLPLLHLFTLAQLSLLDESHVEPRWISHRPACRRPQPTAGSRPPLKPQYFPMKVLHRDPRPTRPPSRALPPGWLTVAFALAPLLLAGCTDDVAANCPPLAHPEVLTVAAASNPCRARKGEAAIQLRTRVVRVYQRTQEPASGHYPLRCGGDDLGYLHLFAKSATGEGDHCDPANDATCDEQIAFTLEHGAYLLQPNGNPRFTVRYNDVQSACHNGAWGFRVIGSLSGKIGQIPLTDGLRLGIITAFRLSRAPANYP